MSDKSRSRSRSRSQQKYQQPTQPEANEPVLYIGGLSVDTQEFDLREIFEEYGAIVSIRILPKDTFALAFVTYSESSSAAKALE
jgi:RNA recognition motif-containing protein